MYHLSIQPISRSKGRSATAAAAYRSADIIFCERYGVEHDYSRKGGVEHTELVGWENDRASLWNAAEAAENRGNARVARECLIALPYETDAEERQQLAVSMANYFCEKYNVAVDVSIHQPSKHGDQRNYHAHLLFTTRVVSEDDKFGKKTRVLDDKKTGPEAIELARSHWSNLLNQFYEKKDEDKRVDHRSYERQGIEKEPTLHLGPHVAALERQGFKTNRKEESDERQYRNQRVEEINQCIRAGEQRVERITQERAERERRLDEAKQGVDFRIGVSERVRTETTTGTQVTRNKVRKSQSFFQRVRNGFRKLRKSWRSLVSGQFDRSHREQPGRQSPENKWGSNPHSDDSEPIDSDDPRDLETEPELITSQDETEGANEYEVEYEPTQESLEEGNTEVYEPLPEHNTQVHLEQEISDYEPQLLGPFERDPIETLRILKKADRLFIEEGIEALDNKLSDDEKGILQYQKEPAYVNLSDEYLNWLQQIMREGLGEDNRKIPPVYDQIQEQWLLMTNRLFCSLMEKEFYQKRDLIHRLDVDYIVTTLKPKVLDFEKKHPLRLDVVYNEKNDTMSLREHSVDQLKSMIKDDISELIPRAEKLLKDNDAFVDFQLKRNYGYYWQKGLDSLEVRATLLECQKLIQEKAPESTSSLFNRESLSGKQWAYMGFASCEGNQIIGLSPRAKKLFANVEQSNPDPKQREIASQILRIHQRLVRLQIDMFEKKRKQNQKQSSLKREPNKTRLKFTFPPKRDQGRDGPSMRM